MTTRERTALALLALGALCVVAAAYAYDGARGAVAAIGVLSLIAGALLGVDDDEPVDDELAIYDVSTGQRVQ